MTRRQNGLCILALGLSAVITTQPAKAQPRFQRIAWTNSGPLYPAWNHEYQVAYSGLGIDGSGESGIWRGQKGYGLELVAGVESSAPGTGTGNYFGNFRPPLLNSNGETAFVASLSGPFIDPTNDSGIWSEGGGNGLGLVAREGNVAPGTGANFGPFSVSSRLSLNSAGQTAFLATLTGPEIDPTNDSGIWSDGSGNGIELIARKGYLAPGTTANFDRLVVDTGIALNGKGQTAFSFTLNGPGVNSTNDSGIWSEGNGNGLELVAREGNVAPGTSAHFDRFVIGGPPMLNDLGDMVFVADLAGPNVESNNNRGIWSNAGENDLHLVVRKGDAVPGIANSVFDNFSIPQINSDGQIVFAGTLSGLDIDNSNQESIWRVDASGVLHLIAQSGDNAPGTNAIFSRTYGPGLNNMGKVGFAGQLVGEGVNGTNDFGLWAEDRIGKLQLIVREGDTIDVSDDPDAPDFRQIELIAINGALNDVGEAFFFARFRDGSEGVFVASLAAVPEPNNMLLICTLLVSVYFARRTNK